MCIVGKKGSGKERKKIGFIYMFTLFGAKCRIVKIYFVWWGRRKKKGRGYMGGGGKRKRK